MKLRHRRFLVNITKFIRTLILKKICERLLLAVWEENRIFKHLQKQPPKVFCDVKKLYLEISQNSQENTCIRASFLIKLQGSGLQLYQKRNSGTGVFQWILRNFWEHPFYRTPPGNFFWSSPKNRSSGLYFFVLLFVHSLIMILLCSIRACNIKYLIFTQNLKQPGCSHIMLLVSRNKINRWSWKQLWPSITRPRYYAFNWVY